MLGLPFLFHILSCFVTLTMDCTGDSPTDEPDTPSSTKNKSAAQDSKLNLQTQPVSSNKTTTYRLDLSTQPELPNKTEPNRARLLCGCLCCEAGDQVHFVELPSVFVTKRCVLCHLVGEINMHNGLLLILWRMASPLTPLTTVMLRQLR